MVDNMIVLVTGQSERIVDGGLHLSAEPWPSDILP